MGKPKVEPLLKHVNRFAALAETDSDDDLPDYAPLSPSFGKSSDAFVEPATQVETSDVKMETPGEARAEPEVSGFRLWKNDITRFSSDKNNIFSSPFSRKGRHKKEEDGWTSIESGISHISDAAAAMPTEEFPSMLNRGDVADALAWAEKVKTSLEKSRHRKLSFFRRSVVLDEKF